jgi:hypothetical protein
LSEPEDVMNSEEFRRDNAGFLRSDDVRTSLIPGITFTSRPVQYAVVDGRAVFEGCIVLGTVEELERQTALASSAAAESPEDVEVAHGVAITGQHFRWPGALMPYTINASLPNQQRVRDAVQHWQQNTNMRFVERTAGNASQYPNFVEVIPSDGCWSQVGMRGGRQEIGLADGCGLGATVHEFGHAWGLWHEQSREDRDSFVTINWANIESGKEHNFNQHISDGDDIGAYDYGSIMHYGRFAFSKNGLATIEPKQSGVTIGQRTGLSAGDIAAVHSIYQTTHYNLAVNQTYATHHAQNAWAHLGALGWRKIQTGTADGVTNTLALFVEAKETGRMVHVVADGSNVYHAYLT